MWLKLNLHDYWSRDRSDLIKGNAKIAFFDPTTPPPPPPTITLCHVCLQELSCVTSRSAQTNPPPLPIKNDFFYKHWLAFKKLWYFLAKIIWRRHFSRACTKNTFLQYSNINSNIWIQFEISNISIRIWD